MGKHLLKESETVELKKSLAELKQGLVSMTAILNKHQVGTLWFGVRNNGAIATTTILITFRWPYSKIGWRSAIPEHYTAT